MQQSHEWSTGLQGPGLGFFFYSTLALSGHNIPIMWSMAPATTQILISGKPGQIISFLFLCVSSHNWKV